MLPDMHGIDLCREVRQDAQVAATPLLVVTGSAQVGLRIAALEAGADDYLTKPLIVDELCARVRAQLRKASPQIGASLQLDPATNSVTVDGQARRLTLREFQLLAYLVRHAGHVCAQDQLLQDVWGYPPEYVDPGLVRWQIRKLRERIEPDPKRPRYIHTVKQRGYMFRDAGDGRATG
jgi:DNA-binding response OmpR family regulator